MKNKTAQKADNWEEFRLPFDIGSGRPDFLKRPDGPAIAMDFYRQKENDHLVGWVNFSPSAQGPPGYVHGGLSAYVLDEAMGTAGWLTGQPVVAASIELEFLQMTPVAKNLSIKAWVEKSADKKLWICGQIFSGEQIFSKSRGLFICVTEEKLRGFNNV